MGRWVSHERTSLENVARIAIAGVDPGAVITRAVNPAPPVVGERRSRYEVLADPAQLPRADPGKVTGVVERPDRTSRIPRRAHEQGARDGRSVATFEGAILVAIERAAVPWTGLTGLRVKLPGV